MESRPLTPTFYSWIISRHPTIPTINNEFSEGEPPRLNFQLAPVEGFGIDRFIAEARNRDSTWDVYVGMTPFIEMVALIEADVIEPWDDYLPREIIDDIIPSIRRECTFDGKLYSWPFLLDVIGLGWNAEITERAGITDNPPKDWETFRAFAQQVIDTKAASYGATFDAHGWRSLAPFAHSKNTDVYYDDGDGGQLFDFTHPDALWALEEMRLQVELSAPNLLNPGTIDGGVNDTPDEDMFAAQEVAYYCKYFSAPVRMANTWPNPARLGLAPLPKAKNGIGSTVFWTTGSCLFRYGQNKDLAVDYLRTLTYDERIWKGSIQGGPTAHPGQLPPYSSLYARWEQGRPDWMQDFVPLVRSQLDVAKAIPNHRFGLDQFRIGRPHWERYLRGEENDPKQAAQAAKSAVTEAIRRSPK